MSDDSSDMIHAGNSSSRLMLNC